MSFCIQLLILLLYIVKNLKNPLLSPYRCLSKIYRANVGAVGTVSKIRAAAVEMLTGLMTIEVINTSMLMTSIRPNYNASVRILKVP